MDAEKPYTQIERVQSLVNNYKSGLEISRQYHNGKKANAYPNTWESGYHDGALTELDTLEGFLNNLIKVLDGTDQYLKGIWPYSKIDSTTYDTMKFKVNDLVCYRNTLGIKFFRVTNVFPNYRQKNLKGYSIQVGDPDSIFYNRHWASVKEDFLTSYSNG